MYNGINYISKTDIGLFKLFQNPGPNTFFKKFIESFNRTGKIQKRPKKSTILVSLFISIVTVEEISIPRRNGGVANHQQNLGIRTEVTATHRNS